MSATERGSLSAAPSRCGKRGVRAVEQPEQVEVDHALPLLERRIDDRPEEHDAGVVDQRVQAAQLRHRGGDGALASAGSVTSASTTRAVPAPPRRSARASRRSRRRATSATVAPSSASATRRRLADATAGAGHEGDGPFQSLRHGASTSVSPRPRRPSPRSNRTQCRAGTASPVLVGGQGAGENVPDYPAPVGSFVATSPAPFSKGSIPNSPTGTPSSVGTRVGVSRLSTSPRKYAGLMAWYDEHQHDAEEYALRSRGRTRRPCASA